MATPPYSVRALAIEGLRFFQSNEKTPVARRDRHSLGNNLVAATIEKHGSFAATKKDATAFAEHGLRVTGAALVSGDESARIVVTHLQGIGRFAIVLRPETAAKRGNFRWYL